MLIAIDVLAAPAAPKRVLVLQSYGQDFAPYTILSGAFRDELTQRLGEPVDIVEVSLVTAELGAVLEDAPFVAYLQALLVGRKPDLIVSMGGPASIFAQRQRQRLFPDVPMLYAALDDEPSAVCTNGQRCHYWDHLDVHGFVQNILDVLPQTRHVAVVVGTSPVEQFWKAQLLREFQPFMNRIEFIWLDQFTFEQMKQRVATMPPHSAILYTVLLLSRGNSAYPDARSAGHSRSRKCPRFRGFCLQY